MADGRQPAQGPDARKLQEATPVNRRVRKTGDHEEFSLTDLAEMREGS
jgi:hypothetical protein